MRQIILGLGFMVAFGCSSVDHGKLHTSNALAMAQVQSAEERLAMVVDRLGADLIRTQEAFILLELRLDLTAMAADGQLSPVEIQDAIARAQSKRNATVEVVRAELARVRTSVSLGAAKKLLEAQSYVLRQAAAEDAAFGALIQNVVSGQTVDGPIPSFGGDR